MELTTPRLRLRPVAPTDCDAFMRIAGEAMVARMTADLPHPLSQQAAQSWLRSAADDVRFAIEHHRRLIGVIGFYIYQTETAPDGAPNTIKMPDLTSDRTTGQSWGELGFLVAPDHWNQGFATEAAKVVLAHGVEHIMLDGFTSAHFADNLASARVLLKCGFVRTGSKPTWCVARQQTLDAATYRLPHRGHHAGH